MNHEGKTKDAKQRAPHKVRKAPAPPPRPARITRETADAMRAAAIEGTPDLCKTLGAIAALHIEDARARKKIYEAVRTLQILAGLPPMPPEK